MDGARSGITLYNSQDSRRERESEKERKTLSMLMNYNTYNRGEYDIRKFR